MYLHQDEHFAFEQTLIILCCFLPNSQDWDFVLNPSSAAQTPSRDKHPINEEHTPLSPTRAVGVKNSPPKKHYLLAVLADPRPMNLFGLFIIGTKKIAVR